MLLDYREAVKRAGTYGLAWLDKASLSRPRACGLPATRLPAGRMSCTTPNIQNLPRSKTYRGCITAEPGSCIVKADYSQIELRIAAVIAQDAAMLEAYRNGQDLHTTTAARLLGVVPERVTSDSRQLAKAVNFGPLYGMGAPRLQTYARQHYRVSLTATEAAQYRQRFFEAYPGLRHWHHQTGATQSTETRTMAGRRRLAVKAFTERLNSPVQGTGADGLKWALARLFAHRDEAPDARLVAVVHDRGGMPHRGRRTDGGVVAAAHGRRHVRHPRGCGPCRSRDDHRPRLGRDAAAPGGDVMTMPRHAAPGITHPLQASTQAAGSSVPSHWRTSSSWGSTSPGNAMRMP